MKFFHVWWRSPSNCWNPGQTLQIEVSLFGSLARGNYAPGSDADIYILLREDTRKITDRIPEFLDNFSKIGVPIEVFPYTLKETEKMSEGDFIKTIQRDKVILSSR